MQNLVNVSNFHVHTIRGPCFISISFCFNSVILTGLANFLFLKLKYLQMSLLYKLRRKVQR